MTCTQPKSRSYLGVEASGVLLTVFYFQIADLGCRQVINHMCSIAVLARKAVGTTPREKHSYNLTDTASKICQQLEVCPSGLERTNG